jgi:hypothetical protein
LGRPETIVVSEAGSPLPEQYQWRATFEFFARPALHGRVVHQQHLLEHDQHEDSRRDSLLEAHI